MASAASSAASDLGGLGVEHGLGQARRQVHGLVGHPTRLGEDAAGPARARGPSGQSGDRAPVPSGLVTSPEPTRRAGRRTDGAPAAPAPTRIVLVRHAVTAETGSMLSGRTPGIDLSEIGRGQAEQAGERLAPVPVAAVYASPIERTTQTAELIAKHHGLAGAAAPRRDRGRLRRVDRREARPT